jgi:hypothetical protein
LLSVYAALQFSSVVKRLRVIRAENLRRRHARERGELRTGHTGLVPPRRAA